MLWYCLPWQRQVADAAEAKKAAVETEGKIAELMSESAAALTSAHAEQGEKTIEEVTAQMGMDKEQEEDQVLSFVLMCRALSLLLWHLNMF